jgi:short-subunit dehydrogenase
VQNGVKVRGAVVALSSTFHVTKKVYITARNKAECDKTAQELTRMGSGICISIPADMQKVEAVKQLVEEVSKNEKGISGI